MKLSSFFNEIGRPVAYYARLNKITGSAIATLFLCQFLYWEGKQRDPDGWIYKTQSDIEEETGLSRREQESARKDLGALGFLEERRVGIPARLEYRPNLDEIDRQWAEFLQSKDSTALIQKREKSQRKIASFGKQKGSNPHGCQIVLLEQSRVLCSSNQGCPTRADILYIPETTFRDYDQRIQKRENSTLNESRPRTSGEENEVFGSDNQEHISPLTTKGIQRNSSLVGLKSSDRIECSAAAKNIEKPKLRYDKNGVFQFPKTGKFKQPSALAVKSLQLELGVECLGFRLAETLDGELMVYMPVEGEWMSEAEIYPLGKIVDLAMHWDGVESYLSVDDFNERAVRYLEFWQEHCGSAANIGKRIRPAVIADVLDLDVERFEDVEPFIDAD